MFVVEVLDTKASLFKGRATKLIKQLVKLLTNSNVSVEVYLVGDSFMEKNVLAFPAPSGFPRPDLEKKKPLGEIYLNPHYITRNKEHFEYMLVHGFLHLLGYDHIKKGDRIKMESLEKRLLKQLGLDSARPSHTRA